MVRNSYWTLSNCIVLFLLMTTLDTVRSSTWSMNELKNLENENERAATPTGMPTSCADLAVIGHRLSSFYTVWNSTTQQTQTIYCDFNAWAQTLIGGGKMVVAFDVQRNSSYGAKNSIIPFQVEILNIGGGMNTTTGVFRAPVDGIYYFAFSGMKATGTDVSWILFQKNGVMVGSSYSANLPAIAAHSGIQVLLKLIAGDKVNMYFVCCTMLFDDANGYSHFTGWLVQ